MAKKLSLPALIAKVQIEFNKFIRNRDKEKGCVSCGKGVEQAGHFYSAGKHTALRFTEDNTHGQCLQCNYFLSANLLNYRKELIRRIGQQRFDILESQATRNKVHKWNRTELEYLLKFYKEKNAKGI